MQATTRAQDRLALRNSFAPFSPACFPLSHAYAQIAPVESFDNMHYQSCSVDFRLDLFQVRARMTRAMT